MPTQVSGTAITTGSIDLTTPLATADGGTGSSTISPYQMVLGTAIATTSDTSHDFTGIPSWVKRITVILTGVSTNGTSNYLVQLGDSEGIENTSYAGSGTSYGGTSAGTAVAYTTGFGLFGGVSAASVYSGVLEIYKVSGTMWVSKSTGAFADAYTGTAGGNKTLSGTLDRIRLTTVNGTDAFDAGSCNIIYEGY